MEIHENTVREFGLVIRKQLSEVFDEREATAMSRTVLMHFLEFSMNDLLVKDDRVLTELEVSTILAAVDRIAKEEPLQYVLGEAPFYDNLFAVAPGVLIPRPETEELVDWVLNEHGDGPLKVIDLCCGSGCIGVTLKLNRPSWDVTLVDVSETALEQSAKNAKALAGDVHIVKADVLGALDLSEYDVVISNPPYVLESEKEVMSPNVLEHEPHLALFVSDNASLIFYEAITQAALVGKKVVFFEINEGKESALIEMIQKAGIDRYEFKQDVHGKPRMLKIEID